VSGLDWELGDREATENAGARLADALTETPQNDGAALITLSGELGAGKTTLVRGLLRRLGVRGAVKSPSYTLVEPYDIGGRLFCHFDLYRIGDPEELEFLGFRDYLGEASAILVEWPERAAALLPAPNLRLHLDYAAPGRHLRAEATGERGARLLGRLRASAAVVSCAGKYGE
jgi:tRNA threonylcarbamoyladenosine biosynthesis protein TsaE